MPSIAHVRSSWRRRDPLRARRRGRTYRNDSPPASDLGPKPFTAEGWLFELKHDGFRAFVRRQGADVELLTRNRRPMARAFPEIMEVIATLSNVVLDAELVVPDRAGRSDFSELQRRARMQRLQTIDDAAARRPAMLIIFDVLESDGDDMRGLPLIERKAWLTANVSEQPGLRLIDGVETHGEALFAAIASQDFEEIVGKQLDSAYKAARQPTWLKIKAEPFEKGSAGLR